MKHLPRLTRLEATVKQRAGAHPAAVDEPAPALLDCLHLFEYEYMGPAPLGVRVADDCRQHISVTDERHTDWLTDVAAAFDAEWIVKGSPRLILLTREETQEAVAAIDRGGLEWRTGRPTLLWYGVGAAMPWTQLRRIDSTARVLRDQGEAVNSLADLRALLSEALDQTD